MKDILAIKRRFPTWGYKKVHHHLRKKKGWHINRKRVYRIWKENGLQAPRRRPRRKAPGDSSNACHIRQAEQVNQVWAVDFLQHQTEDGRRLKILTVVDECSREALNVTVQRRMNNEEVSAILDALIAQRGAPEFIRSDNGSEFIAAGIRKALADAGVESAFIAPGCPWQNGKNERFNGILGHEELDRELYFSVFEAQTKIENYRKDYNRVRPHGAIEYMTPEEFAEAARRDGRWWRPSPPAQGTGASAYGSAPFGLKADTDGERHLVHSPT